ncbi:MAG TPA: DsbA family oxidoreductase [Rhizomicrobium sp.]|nr:DsbA family oxidoreductase [Rhizomicrobium sp.]
MQIDIVSDTVCPWCFIGKRRLERALAQRPDMSFEISWRAYRLDPLVPAEGVDRKAYMRAKFGDSPQAKAMGDALRQAGASEGIDFAFDIIEKRPNTTDSHRLIRWASSSGVQDEVVERLFRAYFEQGRDIGNPIVLAEIASEADMDVELVERLLATDADRELIEREDALAHELGISGVPTFIFANKFLLQGAQDPEAIVRVIDKVQEKLEELALQEE